MDHEPMDTGDSPAVNGFRGTSVAQDNHLTYPFSSSSHSQSYAHAVSHNLQSYWCYAGDEREILLHLHSKDLQDMLHCGMISHEDNGSVLTISSKSNEGTVAAELDRIKRTVTSLLTDRVYLYREDCIIAEQYLKHYQPTVAEKNVLLMLFLSQKKDKIIISSNSPEHLDRERKKIEKVIWDSRHSGTSQVHTTTSSAPQTKCRSVSPHHSPSDSSWPSLGTQTNSRSVSSQYSPGGTSGRSKAVPVSSGFFKPVKYNAPTGLEVQIYKKSIVKANVNVIVNAANMYLQNIGGIAGVISTDAGYKLDLECGDIIRRSNGCLNVTDVVVTGPGVLSYQNVFHAVGPRWTDYTEKHQCLKDLCKTMINIFKQAEKSTLHSVAVPAISAGLFAVPKELCAEVYVLGVLVFCEEKPIYLREIHFVDIDTAMLDLIQSAFERVFVKGKTLNMDEIVTRYPHHFHGSTIKYMGRGGQFSSQRHPRENGQSIAEADFSGHSDVTHQKHQNQESSTSGRKTDHSSWKQKSESHGSHPHQAKLLQLALTKIHGGYITVNNFQTSSGLFAKIYTGSIVKFRGNAIMCSADSSVSGAGPLGDAIKAKGGHKYYDSFQKMKKHIYTQYQPGDILLCDGGNLDVGKVVHAVMGQLSSSNFVMGLKTHKKILMDVLEKADSMGFKKIAMPLIGAGLIEKNEKDLRKCCHCFMEVLCEFDDKHPCTSIREIHFINKNPKVTSALVDSFSHNATSATKTHSPHVPKLGSSSPVATEANAFVLDSKSSSLPSSTYHKDDVKKKHGDANFSKSSIGRGTKNHDFPTSDTDWSKKGAKPKDNRKGNYHRSYSQTNERKGYGFHSDSDDDSIQSSLGVKGTRNKDKMYSDDVNIPETKSLKKGNLMVFDADNMQEMDLGAEESSMCDGCNREYPLHSLNKVPTSKDVYCVKCIVPIAEKSTASQWPDPHGEDDDIRDEGGNEEKKKEGEEEDQCVICMDTITSNNCEILKCGHKFCRSCINEAFSHKPVCPTCGSIYGALKGNQPKNGKMKVTKEYRPLPGYESYDTIVIKYHFPDGVQGPDHPNPGKPYKGTERQGFLPNNREGNKVLRLLEKAFDHRLTFTIGSSRTTGKDDVVTWNDIHHKSKRDTGAERFGYPDPTYLTRVQEELAAKGIAE